MAPVPAVEKLPHIRLGLMPTSLAPFRKFIPDAAIRKFLADSGHQWRDRVYTPLIVYWAMIAQCLDEDHSCAAAVTRVIDWLRARKAPGQRRNRRIPKVSDHNGSYVRARARLPLELFSTMARNTGQDLHALAPDKDKLFGRDIYLIDGSSVSMPDYPELVEQFGKHHGGINRSKLPFPFAMLVAVISLATGAVLDVAIGGCHASEHALFMSIWQVASWLRGSIVVGDSLYGCYGELAMLSRQGIDLIARPNGMRKTDMRKGKRLGPGDRLVEWRRGKKRPAWLEEDVMLPETMVLRLIQVQTLRRGFRPKKVVLVTTLLDPVLYPAEQIAGLYLRRWDIEVDLRHIKPAMGMDVLRGQSPDIVRKEIWSFIATYNLVRRVMWEGSVSHDFPPSGLEFQRDPPTATYLARANRVRPQFELCDDPLDELA